MMRIADLSINRPILTSMILIVFLLFGGLAYFSLPLDLFPKVDIGYVTIRTIYPGAGPREVESQITKPIEDAVAMISKIDFIQSFSMDSASILLIKFQLGKNPDVATQEVKDKIDAILNDLPEDSDTPIVQKYDINAQPVIDIVLAGNTDPITLYELADKKLKDRLSQVEGVAQVNLVGGRKREIRVELDNRTVYENALSLPQLGQILKIQNMDMPGGQFQQQSQEFAVRLKGEFSTIDALRELEIPTPFGARKLMNLASIQDSGSDIRERTTFFDNRQKSRNANVVMLSIIKSSDGNTVRMAEALRNELPGIEKELPAECTLSIVNDKSIFIESAVEDTLGNILMGVLLTGLVLLFFLHDLRSTIIVAAAMPFSIISTFVLLQMSGFSLNIMTLMGLSTSVGVLVTNSVVVLENIFRHKELGSDRKDAASRGTSEIIIAVMASTLTNIVVFLPIASMSSLVGQFFKEFALTVTYATLFSLLVSFTLTPMLASLILPETDTKKHPLGAKLERIFHGWEKAYKRVLQFCIANKLRSALTVVFALILFILSFFSAVRIGFEFMPALDEGDIQVETELPQGYNLEETARLAEQVENRLIRHPEIQHLLTRLGSLSETDKGVNMARIGIKLVDVKEREISSAQAVNLFTRELSDIPNAQIRISSRSSAGSGEAPIKFHLMGSDNDTLDRLKTKIIDQIRDIPGLTNLNTSSRSGKPEITLNPDRRKISDAGLTIYELALTLRSAVEGLEVTRYKEKGEEYPIRIVLSKESADTPEKIGNIPIVSKTGIFRLAQLAKVEFTSGYSKILHQDKSKAVEFTAYPAAGYALGDIVNKIKSQVAQLDLPSDTKIDWGGDVKMMQETVTDMLKTFIIAFLLTYMLLAAMLESLTQPLIILGTVPLSLIGVFWALDISAKTMNTMSMMAIVMLLGIVVNNAILILDYTNVLRKNGMGVSEALLEACPTKLKPILMATIAIILGMAPMAMGIGSAGREFRQPLGVVSIGGLIISTLLTLLVIPAIYDLAYRRKSTPENAQ